MAHEERPPIYDAILNGIEPQPPNLDSEKKNIRKKMELLLGLPGALPSANWRIRI